MANAVAQKQEHRAERGQAEVTRGLTFVPRVDILETQDELVVYADIPGVKPGDVDVHFEKGELTLHARCASQPHGLNYLLWEYGVGDFYRVFTVAEHIDASKISAEIKNGVLTLHLPKTEAVKPRRIAVKGE